MVFMWGESCLGSRCVVPQAVVEAAIEARKMRRDVSTPVEVLVFPNEGVKNLILTSLLNAFRIAQLEVQDSKVHA
jgi:hypothetical protein